MQVRLEWQIRLNISSRHLKTVKLQIFGQLVEVVLLTSVQTVIYLDEKDENILTFSFTVFWMNIAESIKPLKYVTFTEKQKG